MGLVVGINRLGAGLLSQAIPAASGSPTIVDAGSRFQQMDGFGTTALSPFTYSSSWSGVADSQFRSDTGIGQSILNSSIMADGSGNGWPQYTDPVSPFNTIAGDFSIEAQAYARGARVFCVRLWTAQPDPGPYTWQTGGSATGSLLVSEYAAMASCFTSFLSNAWSAGVPWTHVSPMNEPDFTPSSYGQISWTTAQALTFLKSNLAPALTAWGAANPAWQAATGLTSPIILWGEAEKWATAVGTWIPAAEGDSTALAEIGVYATHQYDVGQPVSAPPTPCSHKIWMTEFYDQQNASWDLTMTSALYSVGKLYDGLVTGNANAWMYWWMEVVGNTDNEGLSGATTESLANWNAPQFPKRFYAYGNFSKFVRPGSWRVSVSNPPAGVNILAFLLPGGANDPASHVALVCINTNGSPTAVTFYLKGVAVSQVTPWLTDASNDLVAQTPIRVSGAQFSATLNASSVTSFVY